MLIANRGEIVARIARTLRALGCSPATLRARDDPALVHVRSCDVAIDVDSYLDVEAVLDAARRCGAEAIHPGYGFLSERPELARACEAAGLAWIGPPASAIELMGDKSAARAAAERAGLPILPGLDGPTPRSAAAFAREHGLPVLIKAAAGGGGRGMRLVSSLDQLEDALSGARREAQAAFGDGSLLLERWVAPARHLEVQLLADRHGAVVALGERECSLQRRHQKVIEETPSPAVGGDLREQLEREAVALARACGYVGAGTVEFVAHAEEPARHHFLEMNTRLQVEHPVTEAVRGIDLVEWQLRVAAGEGLGEEVLAATAQGHAVEARVYAEDPSRGFLPDSGEIALLRLPRGEGIRVDAGIAAGERVGTRYDPLIAKVVAHASTRREALARLRSALRDTAVLGVASNVGFLVDLLAQPRVAAGDLDTALVEGLGGRGDERAAARAALVATIAALLDERSGERDAFAALGAWRQCGEAAPLRRALVVEGAREVEVALPWPLAAGGAAAPASADGEELSVAVLEERPLERGRALTLSLDGASRQWLAVRAGEAWWVACEGAAWRVRPSAREQRGEAAGGADLRAPMPGSVLAVHAGEGAEVARGEVVIVMESMKMELQITAPRDGTLAALHVAVGDQVALDAVLASLEPERGGAA